MIIPAYKGRLSDTFIERALSAYRTYSSEMSGFRDKVRDNDRWYKCNYGVQGAAGSDMVPTKNGSEPTPATAFITSAIFSRYADFIDNYPVPNILERSPEDTDTAKKLSEILPVLLELTEFKRKYKRNCYNKMKNGSGIYGVFYDEERGCINIETVDVLDFFCDIRADDIQDSQFVFVRRAIRNDILCGLYPKYSAFFTGDADIEGRDGTMRREDCTVILDCYYKKTDGSVHLMKLINDNTVIDATEDIEGYEYGLYTHGQYPFVIDTMYPDDDNLLGFSLIDIARNPQMYIDKLDAAILKNAMIASHPRWLVKENGGINRKEFTDLSNEVISSATDVDEKNIRMLQPAALPMFVREHRANKISELKEITGNRDWNNGGTAKGVTAASAIEALQSTGQKLSRANIDDTYDSYKRIIYMVIELVRQFFDKEETYRITDESGRKDFIGFSNAEMWNDDTDVFGFGVMENGVNRRHRAEFDVFVNAQKENPFTRETNNQTIMELWRSGYFRPQNMELSVMALQCMHFDGRDKLIELIQEFMERQPQAQQVPGLIQPEAGGEENELYNTEQTVGI